jgi:hypothetical protein
MVPQKDLFMMIVIIRKYENVIVILTFSRSIPDQVVYQMKMYGYRL